MREGERQREKVCERRRKTERGSVLERMKDVCDRKNERERESI